MQIYSQIRLGIIDVLSSTKQRSSHDLYEASEFFSEAKYVLLVLHIYLKLILAQQIENSSNQKYHC